MRPSCVVRASGIGLLVLTLLASCGREEASEASALDMVDAVPLRINATVGLREDTTSLGGATQQDSLVLRRGLLIARDSSFRILADWSTKSVQPNATSSPQRIALSLFRDSRVIGEIDYVTRTDSGVLWSGRIIRTDSSLPGTFVLESRGGALLGTIRVPGSAFYELLPTGRDSTIVQERRQRAPLRRLDPLVPPSPSAPPPGTPKQSGALPSGSSSGANLVAADGSTIDVVVGYTPAARAAAAQLWHFPDNSTTPVTLQAQSALMHANAALKESQVQTQFRLVGTLEVPYREPAGAAGHMRSMLEAMQGAGVPFDGLRRLATERRADLILCLTISSTEGGLAYVLDQRYLNGGFTPWALGVVEWESAVSNYNLAHEAGHLLGAVHDRANAPDPGAYPYAYGWHFRVGQQDYHDIMAYARTTADSVVPRYANPRVRYPPSHPNAQPTGSSGVADVAATLNLTRKLAANFR